MTSELCLKRNIVEAEQRLIDSGVDVYTLIERAGASLARAVGDVESVTAVCGEGKNGADGVSAGIVLADRGVSVRIFTVGDMPCEETRRLLEIADGSGIEIRPFESGYMIYDDVVLDCVFGIGLSREVEGIYLDAIKAINDSGARIISADIPSGLHADRGEKLGECVRADVTVSFSGKKVGYYLLDGIDSVGEIIFADTGINPKGEITLLEEVTFPKRKNNTHKGSYGKVSIIAGCPRFIGAGILAERSAVSALRSGAGLVRLCVPYSVKEAYASRVVESTLCYMPDEDGYMLFDKGVLDDIIDFSDVVAVGPGLGVSEEIKKIVSYLVENFDGYLVLDADALNSISCDPSVLDGAKNVVITPHRGEFARLTGKSLKDIDYINDPVDFAKKHGVTVHLKGAGSVTAHPDGRVMLTASGTPAMAKGGSGDVLTGIVASFLAQGFSDGVERASLIHGLSARKAEKRFGSYGTLATDISESVAEIIAERIR